MEIVKYVLVKVKEESGDYHNIVTEDEFYDLCENNEKFDIIEESFDINSLFNRMIQLQLSTLD